MKLTIPNVPPSLNKLLRMHWAAKRKLNECWVLHVLVALGQNPYLKPIVKMRVKVTLHHSRLYDECDNMWGACKPIFDALKHWKLIYDDAPEYLEPTVEQQKCSRKESRTVIELEAAP